MSETDHVSGDYGAKVFGIHPGDENEPGNRVEMVVGESVQDICLTVNSRLALGHRAFLGIIPREGSTSKALVATILFHRRGSVNMDAPILKDKSSE